MDNTFYRVHKEKKQADGTIIRESYDSSPALEALEKELLSQFPEGCTFDIPKPNHSITYFTPPKPCEIQSESNSEICGPGLWSYIHKRRNTQDTSNIISSNVPNTTPSDTSNITSPDSLTTNDVIKLAEETGTSITMPNNPSQQDLKNAMRMIKMQSDLCQTMHEQTLKSLGNDPKVKRVLRKAKGTVTLVPR